MRHILLIFLLIAAPLHPEPLLFGNHQKEPHPIDVQYEKCLSNWNGDNIKDWYSCCHSAETAWDAKLNEYYKALLPLMSTEERRLLIKSQKAWLTHFEAKKQILTQNLDMKLMVGREGYITVLDNLVQMKKTRALELHDFIQAKKLENRHRNPEP